MQKKELVEKVQKAAEEIGIPDVLLFASSHQNGWEDIYHSDAFRRNDSVVDIGYLCLKEGQAIFKYNAEAFSDERLEDFRKALAQQDIPFDNYAPLGTLFHTKTDLAIANELPTYQ